MKDFLTGVEEKYDKRLLEGRLTIEGNVIACIYSDPLILDEIELTRKDFITSDGSFYFQLAKRLRKNGYSVFDEVTILSSTSEAVQAQFNERGGYTTIKNLVDVISNKNADTYIDNLCKSNIMLHLYEDGFDLFKTMKWQDKEIVPFELFQNFDSESITDWYEAKILDYHTGKASTILEEEDIDFDDAFIESCIDGEDNGVPFEDAGYDINNEVINCYPFLSRQVT